LPAQPPQVVATRITNQVELTELTDNVTIFSAALPPPVQATGAEVLFTLLSSVLFTFEKVVSNPPFSHDNIDWFDV
jgi:hypothetical protein